MHQNRALLYRQNELFLSVLCMYVNVFVVKFSFHLFQFSTKRDMIKFIRFFLTDRFSFASVCECEFIFFFSFTVCNTFFECCTALVIFQYPNYLVKLKQLQFKPNALKKNLILIRAHTHTSIFVFRFQATPFKKECKIYYWE